MVPSQSCVSMHEDLKKLMRKGTPDAQTIQAFVDSHSFPLAEKTDVTFVYRGEGEEV